MVFAMQITRSGNLTAGGSTKPASTLQYLHHDHLGSVAVVTDETGSVAERLAYDPWGKRRFPNGTADTADSIVGLTLDRGFTMHEHLDEMGVIHMNGRIYDPLIGRFMSADPKITYPYWLQSFNRYVYVMNNPLNMVDPSGFDSEGQDDPGWGEPGWGLSPNDGFNSAGGLYAGPIWGATVVSTDIVVDSKGKEFSYTEWSTGVWSLDGIGGTRSLPGGGLHVDIGGLVGWGYIGGSNTSPGVSQGGGAVGVANNSGVDAQPISVSGYLSGGFNVGMDFMTGGLSTLTNSAFSQGNYGQYVGYSLLGVVMGVSNFVGGGAPAAANTSAKTAYSVVFSTTISQTGKVGNAARSAHRAEANAALTTAMKQDQELAAMLNSLSVSPPIGKNNPPGFQWHHSTVPGRMDLVPTSQHAQPSLFQDALHPNGLGGFYVWGNGW